MADPAAYRAIQVGKVHHAVTRDAPLGRQPALCGVFVTVDHELDPRWPAWTFDKVLRRATTRGAHLWCVPCAKCKKTVRATGGIG